MPSSLKNSVRKLLLILLSTVFGLALCEIGLRVLGQKFSGSTLTNDPLLGWSLRPGSSAWEVDEGLAWGTVNSHGYRDRERAINKPPGAYRVAVLGDSYTEARQVAPDKTYTAMAEAELNRNPCLGRQQVEVMNFGIGGFGTGQELLLLRERVWQFKPDLIVLQFYAGNDMFNNHRALNISSPEKAPYFLLKNGKLELDESFRQGRGYDPTYIKLKGMGADVMNKFVLLQLLYKLNRVRVQREELARLNGAEQSRPADKSTINPNAPPPEYQRFLSFLPPTLPAMQEAWQVTEALVLELDREVRAHRTWLLMMVMPADIQINPDPRKQAEYRAQFKIESLEYADDRIEQHARANGIPVLRLTKPLLAEAARTGKYMAGFANTEPNSGHLNEQGHAVVARELVRTICETAPARSVAGN